jgi:hypothetical protein
MSKVTMSDIFILDRRHELRTLYDSNGKTTGEAGKVQEIIKNYERVMYQTKESRRQQYEALKKEFDDN